MQRRWIAVLALCFAGCGSKGNGAAGTSVETGDAGKPGHPGERDGRATDEATLVMDPFTVDPGGEVFMCQSFANPFGESVFIREFETHMSAGSHHLLVNYQDGAPSSLALEPCSGLTPPSGPFATQTLDDRYTYQDGVGAPLPAERNLRLISHYLNSTSSTLSPTVVVTMRRVPPEAVLRPALMQTMTYIDFEIPPHQSLTVSGYGGVGEDAEILWLLPHMHSRGKHFAATIGETDPITIYETNDWEVPPHRFDPPVQVHANDRVGYTCTWVNDTSETLVFGESAAKNEMCLLAYQYAFSSASQ